MQVGLERRLKEVLERLHARSPFARHKTSRAIVMAFEVEWTSITGLDYNNPLCQDGRLVIEAHKVIKREFNSVRILCGGFSLVIIRGQSVLKLEGLPW